MEISCTSQSQTSGIWGSVTRYQENGPVINVGNISFYQNYGVNTGYKSNSYLLNLNEITTVKIKGNEVYQNGVLIGDALPIQTNPLHTDTWGGIRWSGYDEWTSGVHGFKSMDGKRIRLTYYDKQGNILANFVPCYRKRDNQICFYDTARKRVFLPLNPEKVQTVGPDVN